MLDECFQSFCLKTGNIDSTYADVKQFSPHQFTNSKQKPGIKAQKDTTYLK